MSTTIHSFIDIFKTEFIVGDENVVLNKIVIPIIQRDYAQGRLDTDVSRVRNRFLTSLFNAVNGTPITLDFIYGDIDDKGIMTPLDGQQRLTTLFLLHWYAAKKEKIDEEKYLFLKGFSYETRYSARYFCSELVNFTPSFTKTISEDIINQAWFPLDWKKDPTISSMLVMIDAIDERFKGLSNIWERLNNNAVTFYFLPIKDMGLTDELYIKLNSRGKPLTPFEHFKAELERELRIINKTIAERIIKKIDCEWTDLLWRYRDSGTGNNSDYVVDDEFLRYFKFVCDILCYKNGHSPQGYSNDEFDLLQLYFSPDNKEALKNIEFLEASFDCWCNIQGFDNPAAFLASIMSSVHEDGKIIVNKNKIDIFEDCLHSYSDKTGKIRQFPLNRIILLYAVLVYLQNQQAVAADAFKRRLRIVNNLIQNSEDEVSDRLDRNRIPAILQEVDAIILKGNIDDSIENNFNVNQLQEEKEKIDFCLNNPTKTGLLFKLEDHPLLNGQIGIIGLSNLGLTDQFYKLFDCDWDLVDCALMSIGDYGQLERNKKHFQYGSKSKQSAWTSLFHKSANSRFDNTKDILLQLLKNPDIITDKVLENIVSSYVSTCETNVEYPWGYYYVKYPIFRPGSFGKFNNPDYSQSPYLLAVMQTKSMLSQNAYMPYLKATDEKHLSRDYLGQRLVYTNNYIICENDAYLVRDNNNNTVVDRININQNSNGIDIEDRIIKLRQYLIQNQLV